MIWRLDGRWSDDGLVVVVGKGAVLRGSRLIAQGDLRVKGDSGSDA